MSQVVIASKAAAGAFKAGQNISKELYGYDFTGLIVKLGIFYLAALIFYKYVQFVNGLGGAFGNLITFLGLGTPTWVPSWLSNFVTKGFGPITYWNLVHAIALWVLYSELQNYEKSQIAVGGQPQAATQAVFYSLMGLIIAIALPGIISRVNDQTALTRPAV